MAETHNELLICSLDVWGNEEDGYEVNAAYSTGITLLAEMDDEYYYRQVRNYFPHLPPFEIKWQDEKTADIDCRKTGKPLLNIQERY